MNNNTIFDPMAWAAATGNNKTANNNDQTKSGQVPNPKSAIPFIGNELEKAKATVEELIRLGANIAESYDDWWNCGCALAELGPEAGNLFHQISSQSTKYRETDCEKKWQECLSKHDGRITIATFYKMAQNAGVDLSAIGRQFPSAPSNPHTAGINHSEVSNNNVYQSENTDYNKGIDDNSILASQTSGNSLGHEGNAGIEGNGESDSVNPSQDFAQYTETFSDKLDVSRLPTMLRDLIETQTDAEGRDKVTLATLTLYSGAMPGVYGIYDGKRVYPPFYTLIDAPSGADKGVISDCRQLVKPIEWEIRKAYDSQLEEYQQEYAKWTALDKKQRASQNEPVKPPYRSLFIAANSSATSAYQALSDNNEWGIIFETEADTLTQALKQDYGDYSDGLRKAFHHEAISYSRRKDDEHVNLDCPRLAALLTCTPGQVPQLLSPQQVENGLANRFLFYNLKSHHAWRNVFAECNEPIADRFLKIGQRYLTLYHELEKQMEHPIQFVLSIEQQKQFNEYFSGLLLEQIGLYGEQLDAFVKRLGLTTFRMAMVLTVLRCEERAPMLDPLSQTLVCTEEDFQTVMTITNCLINHTTHVYANLLPHDDTQKHNGVLLSTTEKALFDALSHEFTTQDGKQVAKKLGIPWKSAERYIGFFVSKYHIANRIKNGYYMKKS
ncbi:DUF3987 domain-containing protein [Xylanibacter ruminicola]|uniref:Primase C terminal 2 (PriCT-2) n=1 Tax=Xylanibacter ruminicola TaxID=839 RepID=A0A1M6V341_XYLRU|nr:DUF3987 domain-containing protein [Xylanibacter ruminicola]SHK75873.1 Primase C terminal 2 (PriCT-2) [Xylanibacter ruminicola]